MNLALRHTLSVDAFLAWEATQELRFEFDGVAPQAMVGATNRHERIVGNVYAFMHAALRGKPCQPTTSNVKLRLADTVRYPDVMVLCHPVVMEAAFVDDPTVIIEVLSPSTARTDRIDKLEEYRALPSLAHYVMIEQDFMAATVIERSGDVWTLGVVKAGGALHLPSIGVSMALGAAYEAVFDSEGATDTPDTA